CSIFKEPLFQNHHCAPDIPRTFLDHAVSESAAAGAPAAVNTTVLGEAFKSLVVMQNEFWSHYRGTWPRAIDWTASFIHTSLGGMADTLSRTYVEMPIDVVEGRMVSNMLATYFSQTVGFYFGQDYISRRHQVCPLHCSLNCS